MKRGEIIIILDLKIRLTRIFRETFLIVFFFQKIQCLTDREKYLMYIVRLCVSITYFLASYHLQPCFRFISCSTPQYDKLLWIIAMNFYFIIIIY